MTKNTQRPNTPNNQISRRAFLKENAAMIRNYQPLSPKEQADLDVIGKQLARKLGPHYGPVA